MASRSVSFAVVARNEPRELLYATLDGLVSTGGGHLREIVVVDDGSDVPVRVTRPAVLVVRNAVPIGTSQARRQAASLTSGEVLVSIDAHMRFAPNWLDEMLAHVDSGSLLCAAWWNYELTHALCWGADFLWCGERDYTTGRLPGLAFCHRTNEPGTNAPEVPMLMGACYMMLRSSYDKLGGFSPFFRTWGKLEQDLSARAWILGLGVKCVPSAHVGHFSRTKFPYKVRWADIEFNQLATIRTVFDEPAARLCEQLMQPLPADVQAWADETNFSDLRRLIQARRELSDAEFFRRFVPSAPECLLRA
jgi:glycosyltransferase involved in cell wall biosynthesis